MNEARSERYFERRGRRKLEALYPLMIGTGIVLSEYGIDCRLHEYGGIIRHVINTYREIRKQYASYSETYRVLKNRLKTEGGIYANYEKGVEMTDEFIENALEFYKSYNPVSPLDKECVTTANYMFTESGKNPYGNDVNDIVPYMMQVYFMRNVELEGKNAKLHHTKVVTPFNGVRFFNVEIVSVTKLDKSYGKPYHVTAISDNNENLSWYIDKDRSPYFCREGMKMRIAAQYNRQKGGVTLLKVESDNPDFPMKAYFRHPFIPYRKTVGQCDVKIYDVVRYPTLSNSINYEVYAINSDGYRLNWMVPDSRCSYAIGDRVRIAYKFDDDDTKSLKNVTFRKRYEGITDEPDPMTVMPKNVQWKSNDGKFTNYTFRIIRVIPEYNMFFVIDDDNVMYKINDISYDRYKNQTGIKWDMKLLKAYGRITLSGRVVEEEYDDNMSKPQKSKMIKGIQQKQIVLSEPKNPNSPEQIVMKDYLEKIKKGEKVPQVFESVLNTKALTKKPLDFDNPLEINVHEDSSSFSKHTRTWYALSDIQDMAKSNGVEISFIDTDDNEFTAANDLNDVQFVKLTNEALKRGSNDIIISRNWKEQYDQCNPI